MRRYRVEPGGQVRDLPLADLLDQPLEPFHPLPDILQGTRVRPGVRDMVLHGPRQQLAYAIGGTWPVSAQQDVVARLIHVAPPEGLPAPDPSGSIRMEPGADNFSSSM